MEKVITKRRGMSEAYTPTELVREILDSLPDELWEEGKTFVDPECGIGQFLVEVAKIKLSLGHTNVLETIYGTDIMEDNVIECRARLLGVCGDTTENRECVARNIKQGDALTYNYA